MRVRSGGVTESTESQELKEEEKLKLERVLEWRNEENFVYYSTEWICTWLCDQIQKTEQVKYP